MAGVAGSIAETRARAACEVAHSRSGVGNQDRFQVVSSILLTQDSTKVQ